MNQAAQKDSAKVLANLNSLLPDLESVYKDIHSHPELSMQENRTAHIGGGPSARRWLRSDNRSWEDGRCGFVAKR